MDNNGYIPFSSRICFMTGKSPNIKNERQKYMKHVLTS